MDRVVEVLVGLPPLLVLTLVIVLPALESSTLLGLVVPGETAILIGGLVAHGGALPLWAVIVGGAAGACLGDQAGYALGRRYGSRVLARAPRMLRRRVNLGQARRLVTRRGAWAVVSGRWVAVLRTVVPLVAGAGGMHWPVFLRANLLGGLVWAAAVAVLGYLGAASYRYLERELGIGEWALLALIGVGVGWRAWRRARRSRGEQPVG
ncbi:DedA family protein [Micromonospora sp. HUAS LYJ1]|uniref:DedA family protein n=1 Tax=Micromonospora sp. HUAS LYJ1 TaxID=3061626 RepID=UPI00267208BE|nr:DedA family protein [Micromonospora sp. HUAS LYJ1]WKU05454.1 DedA family protein [Micromonospora sp. HUAS LYJ1]